MHTLYGAMVRLHNTHQKHEKSATADIQIKFQVKAAENSYQKFKSCLCDLRTFRFKFKVDCRDETVSPPMKSAIVWFWKTEHKRFGYEIRNLINEHTQKTFKIARVRSSAIWKCKQSKSLAWCLVKNNFEIDLIFVFGFFHSFNTTWNVNLR